MILRNDFEELENILHPQIGTLWEIETSFSSGDRTLWARFALTETEIEFGFTIPTNNYKTLEEIAHQIIEAFRNKLVTDLEQQ